MQFSAPNGVGPSDRVEAEDRCYIKAQGYASSRWHCNNACRRAGATHYQFWFIRWGHYIYKYCRCWRC